MARSAKTRRKTTRAQTPGSGAVAAADASTGEVDPLTQLLCDRVRSLRKKRGWTLEELSVACGVSRSMLSQIERGQANPTLAVTYRIAEAFGMQLGELVDAPSATARIDVIRADDRKHHYRSDRYCRIRTLSPLHLEKDVEFYELLLRPGGSLRSAPHFEGTREFLRPRSRRLRPLSRRRAPCHRKRRRHRRSCLSRGYLSLSVPPLPASHGSPV